MRTLVTCSEGALLLVVVLEPPLFVVAPPVACVPPGFAAVAGSGWAASRHSNAATVVAAPNLDRLWARVLAKTSRLLRAEPPTGQTGNGPVSDWRTPTLSTMARKPRDGMEVAPRGLHQPQRKPTGLGVGGSGLVGNPAGGSGRLKPVGATSLGASAWKID